MSTAAPEQLDFVGSLLVADTRAFVEAWRELLRGAAFAASGRVSELCERSKTLQLRARAAGVGGLAHHLGVCNEHADAADREGLEHCLANVLELAWQLSQELERNRSDAEAASGAVSVPAGEPSERVVEVTAPRASVPPPPPLHTPWPGWKRLSTSEARAAQTPTSGEPKSSPGTEVQAPRGAQEPPSIEAASVPSAAVMSELAPTIVQPLPPGIEPSPATSASASRDGERGTNAEPAPLPVPPPRLDVTAEAPAAAQQPAQAGAPERARAELEEEAPISEPMPSSRSVFAEPVLESGWLDEAGGATPQPPELLSAEPFHLVQRASVPAPPAEAQQPEVKQPEASRPEASQPEASRPEASRPEASRPEASRPELKVAAPPLDPAALGQRRSRPGPPRPARAELAQRVAEIRAAAKPAPSSPTPPTVATAPQAPAPVPSTPAPVPPPERLDSTASAPAPAPPTNGAALAGVLGLAPAGQASIDATGAAPAALSEPASVALALRGSPAPPRLLAERSGAPLSSTDGAEEELTEQDLEIRLERVRRAAPFPLGRGEIAIDLPPPSEARAARRPPRARLWWLPPLALGVLGGIALLALVLRPWDSLSEQAAAPQAAMRSEALLPVQRLTDDREARLALLALVQGGGKESSELADLIHEEVALVAKALVEPCAPGSPSCRIAEQARQMLAQPPLEKPPPPAPAPLGSWLSGLRQPLIGVKDDPRVQRLVEYHTNDPVGRELFQGLLFRCGAHQSLFSDALMQHGLPLDLIAVPMVESACVLDAESPVGARGLWQFMPATARAYHLRVQAGVLDERLNPLKATDAALEFLRDLRSKLGSWELALASYNMGPFGLLSRLNRAGPGADFWDLVDAQRLPQETAAYVPKIQAYALILANLEHFRFDTAQQMLGTSSTAMMVPAGTRLGQVARAVGCSATRIRELNPDVLADVVPGAAGEEFSLRVPSDGAPRAREALERLVARADNGDECVPANFDWGKQRLTKAMLSRCKR